MKFDDTKKIFENWKHNVENRLDEVFAIEEDRVAVAKDPKTKGKKILNDEDKKKKKKECPPNAPASRECPKTYYTDKGEKVHDYGEYAVEMDPEESEGLTTVPPKKKKDVKEALNKAIELEVIKIRLDKLLD